MKKFLLVLILLLVSPLAMADDDDSSDDRMKNKPGDVVAVDAYGETVGVVTDVWTYGGARVFLEIGRKDALLFLEVGQIGTSHPPGPMLFFENPGCTGKVYARPEHVGGGWLEPKVVIVPGFVPDGTEPSFERFAYYATTADPGNYDAKSNLSPEGYCHIWHPGEAFAWPVRKIKACRYSWDLHTCYPPPYELDVR